MTGDALEAYAPNGFASTMIARNVLMFDVLVDVVRKFEEFGLVLYGDAFLAKVVVWLQLRLVTLTSRKESISALVTLET